MKIGFLQKREDGRVELQDENGNYITYFTSGEPIEIFVEGYGWINGRVEHSDDYGGYYFYNLEGRHRSLYNGIKARCN